MRKFTLLFLAAFFITGIAYSQAVIISANKKPFITLETSGSLEIPIMDLKATNGIGGFYKFTDYGASIGYGGAIDLKFAVYSAKRTQLRTYLSIGYSHFVNDDSKAYNYSDTAGWVHPGYPQINSVTGLPYQPASDTLGISNMRMNIPYLAVGGEFGVYTDKRNRSSINFGVDIVFSVIFGKYYQTIKGKQETFTTLNQNSRTGLGLNASYSLKLTEVVGFHVGTRFAFPNLFGKSSAISDADATVYLLDKGDPALNKNLSSDRSLGYIKFFGGLSLFFGKM
jgi:hypothetical protein